MQSHFKYAQAVLFLGVIFSLSGTATAQTAPKTQSTVTGTVSKVDESARTITLKTDAGQEISVRMDASASFRRIAPGETDLRKAATIQFSDITTGDRVLARGKADNQTLDATLIVSISKGDIAKKQEAERADWDKRGVTGLVTSASAGAVIINVRTLGGIKQVTITPAPNAIVRRYAPDSVNFADAKTSTLSDIKPGDQVRARGDKSPDGSQMSAVEIVSGTFKTIAGLILSVNPQANEMQVRDLDTKKPLTVKINPDSKMQKLQPQLARMIAARLHPEAVAGGPGAEGRGRGDAGRGARRGQGGFGRGQGGGRGFAGGGGRGGDLQQMLDNSPTITVADLKPGDAIVVSSTVGASANEITAIKLLAGVEPILTKPGTQEMSLGSWSLDMGGGIDAQ